MLQRVKECFRKSHFVCIFQKIIFRVSKSRIRRWVAVLTTLCGNKKLDVKNQKIIDRKYLIFSFLEFSPFHFAVTACIVFEVSPFWPHFVVTGCIQNAAEGKKCFRKLHFVCIFQKIVFRVSKSCVRWWVTIPTALCGKKAQTWKIKKLSIENTWFILAPFCGNGLAPAFFFEFSPFWPHIVATALHSKC